MLEVVGLMHVGVSFAFEADALVGIAPLAATHEPFDGIPKVETGNEQFQHLYGVDALVVNQRLAKVSLPPTKQNPEEVECLEPLRR